MNDLSLYANPRTFEEWSKGLHARVKFRKMIRWEIGDYLLIGEARFGQKIWQVIEDTGFSEGDIRNMMSCARHFPPDERSMALGWSWHVAMLPLPKAERDAVMTRALAGEIGRAEIRLLAASQNGSNGTTAKNGANPAQPIETRMAGIVEALGEAVITLKPFLTDGEPDLSGFRAALAHFMVVAGRALREITPA